MTAGSPDVPEVWKTATSSIGTPTFPISRRCSRAFSRERERIVSQSSKSAHEIGFAGHRQVAQFDLA